MLVQNVECCTDCWLELDLMEATNSDAFFIFDNELRSIMYAASRDASISDEVSKSVGRLTILHLLYPKP